MPEFGTEELEIPELCRRCPRVFTCFGIFNEARDGKAHVIKDHEPGDFEDRVVSIGPEGPKRLSDDHTVNDDQKARLAALAMDRTIGDLENMMEAAQMTATELTADCPGVHDLSDTTTDGELIGVTVCRSPSWGDRDTAVEPAAAFVYRRQT